MPSLNDQYKSSDPGFDRAYQDLTKPKPPKLTPTGTTYGTPERRREVFGNNPAYGADYDPGKFYELYGRSAGTEDKLGQSGLQSLIAGGGYFPDEKEKLQALMSREIGARSTLESNLLNERGASMPGGGSSGFSDNLYANVGANARQALSQYNLGLQESGQERRYGAISQLYGSEETERQRRAQEAQAKRNFASSLVSGFTQSVGEGLGQSLSSSAYKTEIKPAYSSKKVKSGIKVPTKRSMLGALKNLDLKTYKYKDGIIPEDDGKEHIGVIAEETPDNLKAGSDKVDLSDILFMAVGALQELSAKVEELSGLGALKAPEVT